MTTNTIFLLRKVLGQALAMDTRDFDMDTGLAGALPQFDSMTVMLVILGLEDTFRIHVAGDEIDASVFATVASLHAYVEHKIAAAASCAA
ncbi:MAG: acyl carrier protein [Rhodocyclaceae bacterium]